MIWSADVQMPKMDGITAMKQLRSWSYDKPVIALTAHAMQEERTLITAV